MTPMIDVTFQLIIFFMLVTELTNLALEDVVLPIADQAQEHSKGRQSEVVINVVRQSQGPAGQAVIKIGGQEIKGQGQELLDNLAERLFVEAQVYNRWIPHPVIPGKKLSELEVLVRADREARAEYFHIIMAACLRVGIYRVHVAARQELPVEGSCGRDPE